MNKHAKVALSICFISLVFPLISNRGLKSLLFDLFILSLFLIPVIIKRHETTDVINANDRDKNTKRLVYLDVAKFVAIIAIIIGHTDWLGVPVSITNACYAFSVPIFVFISGYLSKDKQLTSAYVLKNARTLLLPYVATVILHVIFSVVDNAFYAPHDIVIGIKHWLIAGAFGAGTIFDPNIKTIGIIGAIWFLLALFTCRIVDSIIYTFSKSQIVQTVLCVIIFFSAIMSAHYIQLPFSLQSAGVCYPFFYIGKLFKKYNLIEYCENNWPIYIAIFVVGLTNMFCFGHSYYVSLYFGDGLFWGTIGGLCSSLTVLYIVKNYERSGFSMRILSHLGTLTLVILCAHILELNLFHWNLVMTLPLSETVRGLFVALPLQIINTTIICLVFYFIPFLRWIFFPNSKSFR